MKILHVIPYYKPAYIYGGPVLSVSSLCEGLSRAGHEVEVCTTLANGNTDLELDPEIFYDVSGVNVQYFNRITGDFSQFSPRLLRYVWLNAREYDIIHISGWWNSVSVLVALLCYMRSVRPVISMRGMLSHYTFGNKTGKIKKVFHSILGKRLLSHSVLHATVDQEMEVVHNYVNVKTGFILPNYLELPEKTFERSDRREGERHMVFLGRVHPKKNIELWFDALQNVDPDVNWKVSIVGTGEQSYLESLKNLANTYGISNRVNWLGHIEGDGKFEILANSQLMVLLSYSENFANTVPESLFVGTPVFLSEHVGMAGYVKKMGFGAVVSLDRDEVVKQLNRVLKDWEQFEHIREVAPSEIFKSFSGATLIDEYETEYRKFKK